jgi:hypothetical protein
MSSSFDDGTNREEWIAQVDRATAELSELLATESGTADMHAAVRALWRSGDQLDAGEAAVARATLTLLAARSTGVQVAGVCRAQKPFADVYEVIDADSLGQLRRRLCCTHKPKQHCV